MSAAINDDLVVNQVPQPFSLLVCNTVGEPDYLVFNQVPQPLYFGGTYYTVGEPDYLVVNPKNMLRANSDRSVNFLFSSSSNKIIFSYAAHNFLYVSPDV